MDISQETEKRLHNLIYYIGKSECKLERTRVSLCSFPLFIPYQGFKLIATGSDNLLYEDDFYQFLRSHEYDVDKYSCYYFLKQYDSSNKNSLKFKDFLEIILPKENNELRFDVVQRTGAEGDPKSNLGVEIEEMLAQLLYLEVITLKDIEKLRSNLSTRMDFNANALFEILDVDSKGCLGFETLGKYFNDKNNEEIINGIMRKFNTSKNGKISYLEFLEGIMPFGSKAKSKPEYMQPTHGYISKSQTNKGKNGDKTLDIDEEIKTEKTHKSKRTTRKKTKTYRADYKPKPLREETKVLFELFREEMKQESKIDIIKQNLALKSDVSLGVLYSIFSTEESLQKWLSGFIPGKDAKTFCNLIYKKFDKDEDKKLTEDDIKGIFLPLQENYGKLLMNRNNNNAITDESTIKVIISLIDEYVVSDEFNRNMKEQLPKDQDIVLELFGAIDEKHMGYFGLEEVNLIKINR